MNLTRISTYLSNTSQASFWRSSSLTRLSVYNGGLLPCSRRNNVYCCAGPSSEPVASNANVGRQPAARRASSSVRRGKPPPSPQLRRQQGPANDQQPLPPRPTPPLHSQEQPQEPGAHAPAQVRYIDTAALEAEYTQSLLAAGVTQEQQVQLEKYLDYMLETNKVMNLTGPVSMDEMEGRRLGVV